jgi:hypothetical protein
MLFALQKLESDRLHDSGSSTNNDDGGEKLSFYSAAAAAYKSCRVGTMCVSYVNTDSKSMYHSSSE